MPACSRKGPSRRQRIYLVPFEALVRLNLLGLVDVVALVGPLGLCRCGLGRLLDLFPVLDGFHRSFVALRRSTEAHAERWGMVLVLEADRRGRRW